MLQRLFKNDGKFSDKNENVEIIEKEKLSIFESNCKWKGSNELFLNSYREEESNEHDLTSSFLVKSC